MKESTEQLKHRKNVWCGHWRLHSPEGGIVCKRILSTCTLSRRLLLLRVVWRSLDRTYWLQYWMYTCVKFTQLAAFLVFFFVCVDRFYEDAVMEFYKCVWEPPSQAGFVWARVDSVSGIAAGVIPSQHGLEFDINFIFIPNQPNVSGISLNPCRNTIYPPGSFAMFAFHNKELSVSCRSLVLHAAWFMLSALHTGKYMHIQS